MFENKEEVEQVLTMSSKIMTDFACLGTVSETLKVNGRDVIGNGASRCRFYGNTYQCCVYSI